MKVDPQGQRETIYNKEMYELDLWQGELKFLSENYEKINIMLKLEKRKNSKRKKKMH